MSIVYPNRADDEVEVVTVRLSKTKTLRILPPTDEEIEQRAWDKLPPDALNPQFIQPTDLPTEWMFRNAWKIDNGVSVDMEKAREIYKNHLRHLRAPKLAALDIEYQRADELGDIDQKKAIAVRKQALRDITADPRIAAAATPEALKIAVPINDLDKEQS